MRRYLLSLLAAVATLGCTEGLRRFPLAEPMWQDPDQNALTQVPAEYYSGINGDGLDKLLLRPLSHYFAFEVPGEAVNVNAVDEVPNSSWFQNRVGMFEVTPTQAAQAECGEVPPLDPMGGEWTVVGAKPNGANPGFVIKGPDGYRYLLKFDGTYQPLRATSADVIGSKLYWLAGYHSVCNEIVYFDPKILKIDPKAKTENKFGEKVPMTQQDLETVLGKAFRTKAGIVRASASRFVPGQPIGPFKYQDSRDDDPNDVIVHEDRRELRGAQLLAAWLNHVDAREQNSFDVMVQEQGRYYIRHYQIDWGDCLGFGFNPDRLARRLGHAYAMDFGQAGEDAITLGWLDRPWHHVKRADVEIFGYYDVASFTPSKWKNVYALPAFTRRTPRDILWMVRILSRITDDHIAAVVKSARLPDPRQETYLYQTIVGRRDKFFQEYLTQYAPLTQFTVVRRDPKQAQQAVCFEDLALKHGVASPNSTHYKMRFVTADGAQLGWLQFTPDVRHPAWSCVALPVGQTRPSALAPPHAADDDARRYGILKVFIHQTATVLPMAEVDLHFYDLGPERGFRLVGIERPQEASVPKDYYY